jgi:hypothetical protein
MKADQKASPYRLSKMAGRVAIEEGLPWIVKTCLFGMCGGLTPDFFFLPVALVFACCERVGLAVFAWLTGLAVLVI